MAEVRACIEALCVRALLKFFDQSLTIDIYNDSSSTRGISSRLGCSKKTKHFNVKTFWVQKLVHDKAVRLHKVKGTENEADIGTKYLDATTFLSLIHI